MNLKFVIFLLLFVGIAIMSLGGYTLSQDNAEEHAFKEASCTVISEAKGDCGSSESGDTTPCGVFTLEGTVCGVNSTVTLYVPGDDYHNKYPIDSRLPCWVDAKACTISSQEPESNTTDATLIVALGAGLVMFGVFLGAAFLYTRKKE